MVRNLIVIKQPRRDPISDKAIDFPPLENLHLELLENKKKLKPGLPLIPLKPRKPPRPIQKSVDKPPSPQAKTTSKEPDYISQEEEDEELLATLGADTEPEKVDPVAAKIGVDEAEEEVDLPDDEAQELEDETDPYAGLSPEEREVKEREEYIWRFIILKKKYKNPSIEIPSFNEHSDLKMMKNSYDRTIKELYIDDAAETYRTYLIGGFIVMEYVCTQWLNIDLSGFTIQQTRMMHKYDMLLIELGEKSYTRWGVNLPVEVRLLGLILLQAGIFYTGKIISNKFGSSIAELYRGMTGQPPTRTSQPETKPKKRKMRGPKIKPEDIRNMADAQEMEED